MGLKFYAAMQLHAALPFGALCCARRGRIASKYVAATTSITTKASSEFGLFDQFSAKCHNFAEEHVLVV